MDMTMVSGTGGGMSFDDSSKKNDIARLAMAALESVAMRHRAGRANAKSVRDLAALVLDDHSK